VNPNSASTYIVEKVPPTNRIGLLGYPLQPEKKAKRLALYRMNEVRRLVDKLLSGKSDFRPQRDPVAGDYVFEVEGLNKSKTSALLDELETCDVLQKYRLDSVPTCPTCGHSNFYINYVCPFCQHRDLERATMIEHYNCGHTDFETSFTSGDRLVCPKCSRELKLIGTDYRKMDRVYHCSSCKRYFGTPGIELACRMCEKLVPTDQAQMVPTFGYRINEELRDELVSHCSLESSIVGLLGRLGYETKVPWSEKGISGTEHIFDIYARKEGAEVVLDMTSGAQEIGAESVVAFFGKVYDLNPRRAILVVMPGLSKDAQRLSELYKVEVVSGASVEELVRNLDQLLGKGVVLAPKPEIVKEDWFDAVDLRSLRDKMTTVMEKTEKALRE
jgi:ribosomal protein L37AE/L43A